jgi:heat shock protein HtpX
MKNSEFNQYNVGSVNWRDVLRRNQHRSYFVIFSFIIIYVFLGLILDLFFYSNHYPTVPLGVIFKALITWKITPYATIITTIIAIISLWITFRWYDKLMLLGVEYFEVTPQTARSLEEKQLYHIVEELQVAAGLRYTPRVFIIEADYMNAFASGYSEKSAMVAITRGLMQKLNRNELQAVMAHEMSHIRHMDIKLTLMASVLTNLMLIILDVLFYSVLFSGGRERRRDAEGGGGGANIIFIAILLLRYILPLITVLLMLYLSRTREYMADAGCVELMRDNSPLASALLKIQGDHEQNQQHYATEYQQTPHEAIRREAYIFDPTTAGISPRSSLSDLFSTHPSISKRLAALGFTSKENTPE